MPDHPHSADDERTRLLTQLADLHRLQDRAAAEGRPALLHACSLLVKIQAASVEQLLPPSAPPAAGA